MNIGFDAYVTSSSHPCSFGGSTELHLRLRRFKGKCPYGISAAKIFFFLIDAPLSAYELNILWKGTIEI